jgi:hypothetical protein
LPPVSPADDLPCVAFVDLRAGRADVLAAAAARDTQHPSGLARRVIQAGSLASRGSIASMRPCRRTGLAQLPVAASCCSQRVKSSHEARASSSQAGAGCGPSSVVLRAAAGTVMEPGPTVAPLAGGGRVLHLQRTWHGLPSCSQARCSSEWGARDAYGHRTATAHAARPISLLPERAVPHTRGDQIAAAVWHQLGSPAKQRQIEPLAVAQNGHIPRIPRQADCRAQARPAATWRSLGTGDDRIPGRWLPQCECITIG